MQTIKFENKLISGKEGYTFIPIADIERIDIYTDNTIRVIRKENGKSEYFESTHFNVKTLENTYMINSDFLTLFNANNQIIIKKKDIKLVDINESNITIFSELKTLVLEKTESNLASLNKLH